RPVARQLAYPVAALGSGQLLFSRDRPPAPPERGGHSSAARASPQGVPTALCHRKRRSVDRDDLCTKAQECVHPNRCEEADLMLAVVADSHWTLTTGTYRRDCSLLGVELLPEPPRGTSPPRFTA